MRIELRNPEPKFSLCISVSSGVVEKVDPGLIVIGAFGHSRTREMFFRAITRSPGKIATAVGF
ncbi:hypothetical protein [Phyllobacterium endophyticum]|uniref:hypothetical protein n=1 Tax=Phyllobacterium endophyticum TaxID=1149773 RepID=UPI0011C90BE6|nr:hypothetical protein [Phyllobacterium endophyticum]TXR46985.1 hypothetical protein FVA77_21960 [Phyllobacterium endophyticum]